MKKTTLCYCQSGIDFDVCCGRYLRPEADAVTVYPETAEALMRSRYCAYVLADEPYLLSSWHPSTCPLKIDFSGVDSMDWTGLSILRTDKGQAFDTQGEVEFTARYTVAGVEKQLHENSRFAREGGKWVYVDGKVKRNINNPLEGSKEKTGRNQLCPCGSGKKYKHCCLKKG